MFGKEWRRLYDCIASQSDVNPIGLFLLAIYQDNFDVAH